MKQWNQLTFFFIYTVTQWQLACNKLQSLNQHTCTLCIENSTVFCSANMYYCLLKHENTYFPWKYTPVLALCNMSVFLCTLSHTAPYAPFHNPWLSQVGSTHRRSGHFALLVWIYVSQWRDLMNPFRQQGVLDAPWSKADSGQSEKLLSPKAQFHLNKSPSMSRRYWWTENSYNTEVLVDVTQVITTLKGQMSVGKDTQILPLSFPLWLKRV